MFNNKKVLKYHKDLAFNVQWRLEEVVKLLVKDLIKISKISLREFAISFFKNTWIVFSIFGKTRKAF